MTVHDGNINESNSRRRVDVVQAGSIADQLARSIADRPLGWRGNDIAVSASIGVAEWRPDSPAGLADSLPLADAALLGTKRDGRNGSSVYRPKQPRLRIV